MSSAPMSRRTRTVLIVSVLAVVAAVGSFVSFKVLNREPEAPQPSAREFLARSGDQFVLDGQPFFTAGSNNYRPMRIAPVLVDEIMRVAAENNLGIMRVWGFNDVGNADGTNAVDTSNASAYFHYWDGDSPAYNDSETGLQKLDYVIASAKQHGIRLVIPFVNNWASFGGMDQYVRWAEGDFHSDFYTDPTIKGWYRDWVAHLLERTNVYTGVRYKDEPTIAFWELANEARCGGGGQYPPSPGCTTETITAWAQEMAAYVKSIDRLHLLGFGDEGFFCDPSSPQAAADQPGGWTYDCSQGVDAEAIARIDEIDMVGLHVYPDHWGTTAGWATDYITRHAQLADEVGKPLFIGEYGWRGDAPRNAVFHQWLTAFRAGGGDIALYWQMQPRSPATTPQDTDGFTAYCPSAVCTQVSYWSQAMQSGRTDFPPVADDDFVVVDAGETATLDLLASDVSLFSTLDAATVDLDPATSGVQQSLTLPSGSVSVAAGTLTYTPSAGYSGRVEFSYTVSDVTGRSSDVATVVIRVLEPADA